MSLDYPYYEELCRRRHRAAWWWLVGDRLYYLGLLAAMLAALGAAVGLAAGLLGFGWHFLVVAGITFPVGSAVFFAGAALKGHAYTLAERDGISAVEVHQRGCAPRSADAEPGAAPDRLGM
jgi:hypothetical protein